MRHKLRLAVTSTIQWVALMATIFSLTPAHSLVLTKTSIWEAHKGLRSPSQADEPKVLGWTLKSTASLNFSLMSSQDVVGQTDGTSQSYGLTIKSALNRRRNHDEWRNQFNLSESTTKTPAIPRFVKSSDELKLSSTYLYSLPQHPKIGPYARAEATAPLFYGEDVRSDLKTYRITEKDGSTSSRLESSLRLTDSFYPFTTKEAIGLFYKVIEEEYLQVETRIGAAALQIKSGHGYTIKGVNSSGEIEVNALRDVTQSGFEAALGIKGKINQHSGFEFSLESLTPLTNDKQGTDNRNSLRLTNIDGSAKLISKVSDWVSMSYDYKLKLQPQLVDRAQQIHMFVLNITYPLKPEAL